MMENGAAVVEDSHREGKLMENDGLDSVVVENNNTKPVESVGSEEDEVFEEAVESEIPLDRVHDAVTNGDDTVNSDELSSDHAQIDDKAGPENDFDNFEETIGVPLSVVIEQEELPVQVPVDVEDSPETPMHSELDGGVDEAENPPKDELGEHEKIVQISPCEQEGGDISDANPSGKVGNPGDASDINPTGEVGSPRDGNQTEKNYEIVAQVGENGVQESVSLPEIVVQENSDVGNTTEISVNADEQPEAGGDSDSVPAKSPGENLFQDENGEEGKESLGLSDTDHKDSEILVKEDLVVVDAVEGPEAGDSVIVSGGDSGSVFTNSPEENLYQDANGEDGKESLGLSDNDGHKDSEILVKEDFVVSDSHTDREPEVKDQSVNIDMVHEDDQIKDLKEETSSSPVHLDANGMKEPKVIAKLGLESQDDGELDRDSVSADSNHLGANGESEKKALPTAEEPDVITPEADILPTSDDSGVVKVDEATEKLPVSEDAAIVEIVEKMDDLPTPRDSPLVDTGKTIGAADPDVAVGRKFEGSQNVVVVDKDVEGSQNEVVVDKDVEASTVGVKEPETKGVIHEEVRQNVQATREAEIKPAAVFLPSRKPADQNPTPARPAGLGGAAPLLEPSRVAQQSRVNGTSSHVQAQLVEDPSNGETEENDETREKLQMIRVKFLRLAHRLGQTPHNVVVAQVLYRLGLAEQLRGRNGGRVGAFSFDRASAMAEHLEAAGQEPLDFSCTIMVLGKSGVGKSATINSIFDEAKFGTDAFQLGTKKVQDVVGTVQGIKVRVIDTPGLLPSWSDQRQNEKILHSVKRFIKKTPPDIVLYLDRLDMQSRDFGDMPLLRTITDIFGTSIWFNAIVVLTHAASAPPEGPNGTATSYDMFVTQRSHVVQQAIRQAAGDMRLMNPVSLVENHSACRINRAGQRVLPNGQVWKPHLLLLSFASKILAEANTLLKLQDSPPGRPFATRTRAPPLPFLLSSLLQSRPQLKLPEEQFGDDDDTLDDDLDESSDSDDESAYDDLPPFKRLSKAQLAKLTKAQKRAYHDELEYREKLFMKKQLKEEKKRRRFMKKMADSAKDLPSDYGENVEEESGGAASVPVAMPDLALPASFDSDNPTHRYRYLDSPNQWVVRPVLDTHGWDHDIGYEGVNVEKVFVVKQEIPVSFSGQVTKDKKDSNLQMEISSSVKHGKDKATSLGLDMQTLGKDMVYTLRSETRFSNYRQNKATAGLSVTMLGDALTAGVKIEDKLIVNKRFRMVVSGGAMAGRGDVAYGGSLEATLRDKDHPLGRSLTTLGLSVMDWHGDLAIGGNLQSQIPIGRSTNLIARANLNNRSSGQVSIRLNSSEQLQIALVALLPLLRKLYPQQLQFGQW